MTAPVRTRPPWIVWLGLAVVLAAAAVLSFDALRSLALAVSIPAALAWLLPVAVDAGAAVSCSVWLGGRTHPDAARFAGRMTWSLLAVTVVGNAGQLGMHAHAIVPPWWVAVAVGSIPPAVVGAAVHLVVLLARRPTADQPADRGGRGTVGEPTGSDVDEELAALAAPLGPGQQTAEPTVPDREPTDADRPDLAPPMTDADILAEAKAWAAELGRPPSRDEMLERYEIGASRCKRLRGLLGWGTPTAEADREPTGQPTAVGEAVG